MVALAIGVGHGFTQEQSSPSDSSRRQGEEVYRFADSEDGSPVEAGAVWGAATDEAAGRPVSGTAFGVSDLLRMVLVLLLVVGAVYGVLALLRRKSRPPDLDSSAIRLLASQSLPANKAVHAVQVGSSVYLLGAAEGSLSVIATISDQETIDTLILERSGRSAETGAGFGAMLGRWLTGFADGTGQVSKNAGEGRGASAVSPSVESSTVLQLQRQRLRDLG